MGRHAFDIVTIGGGSAGLIAAAFAAGLGARTALVEKAQLGGVCLWTGCVPSKALLHAAAVAHTIRHAAEAGIEAGPVGREQAYGSLRYAREARGRVQEASGAEQMLRSLGVEIFYGDGRFQSRLSTISPGSPSRPRGSSYSAPWYCGDRHSCLSPTYSSRSRP